MAPPPKSHMPSFMKSKPVKMFLVGVLLALIVTAVFFAVKKMRTTLRVKTMRVGQKDNNSEDHMQKKADPTPIQPQQGAKDAAHKTEESNSQHYETGPKTHKTLGMDAIAEKDAENPAQNNHKALLSTSDTSPEQKTRKVLLKDIKAAAQRAGPLTMERAKVTSTFYKQRGVQFDSFRECQPNLNRRINPNSWVNMPEAAIAFFDEMNGVA